jgi:hypothetical protein
MSAVFRGRGVSFLETGVVDRAKSDGRIHFYLLRAWMGQRFDCTGNPSASERRASHHGRECRAAAEDR